MKPLTESGASASDLLSKYAHLKLSSANEAETRLKLIDSIFFGLLDWTYEDVTVEERVTEDDKSTYTDYIFRTANTAFVVEAKKVGISFQSVGDSRKARLSGRLVEGRTGEAIRQARDYCRKKSIQFAVVTNGAQWLIFPGVRTDQVSFSQSSVLIFDSLTRVLGEEFDDFYGLLSRDAVVNGNLELELLGRSEDQFEERRLGSFYRTIRVRTPNPLYPLLHEAIVQSFADSIIERDDDLLAKCYVSSADRVRFDRKINMHLQREESLFSTSPKKPLRRTKDAKALSETLKGAAESSRALAVLVLGPVGAGKTTYLHYSRRVAAANYFQTRSDRLYPQWLEIDFRQFATDESLVDFIYRNILRHMQDDPLLSDWGRAIRPAYSKKIESLRKGPLFLLARDEAVFEARIAEMIAEDYQSAKPYVDLVLSWCGSHVPVFLVVDNVDQLEDSQTQSNIFAASIAITSRIGAHLVVSLRESTYVEHRHSPVFDAFDFDPVQIEPPQIFPVLSKRFFVARNLLKGRSGEFTTPGGAVVKAEDLLQFIGMVQKSVLGTEVGAQIEVLADGDVRLALRMTREFLETGYTDPAKAIQVAASGRDYVLPKHEALRSIILGNRPVYSEQYSVIGNPFDARLSRTGAQLLRIFILNALVRMSSDGKFRNLDGLRIKDACNKVGFSDDYILQVLKDLCRLNFLHTSSHGPASLNASFFPSRLGGHVVRELMANMTFVENVMMDTFIDDTTVWEELRALSDEIRADRNITRRVRRRVQRVKAFYDFMVASYIPLQEEAQRRALPSEWCGSALSEAKEKLWQACNNAIESSERNYPAQ